MACKIFYDAFYSKSFFILSAFKGFDLEKSCVIIKTAFYYFDCIENVMIIGMIEGEWKTKSEN
jgi:hypothetical protein